MQWCYMSDVEFNTSLKPVADLGGSLGRGGLILGKKKKKQPKEEKLTGQLNHHPPPTPPPYLKVWIRYWKRSSLNKA